MGIVGMTAGFVGAALGGLDAGDSSGVVATVLWGLFLTSMASLFGVGVGMVLKHGAMATSSVLIWALVVENLIRGFARRPCLAACPSAPPPGCSASARPVTPTKRSPLR